MMISGIGGLEQSGMLSQLQMGGSRNEFSSGQQRQGPVPVVDRVSFSPEAVEAQQGSWNAAPAVVAPLQYGTARGGEADIAQAISLEGATAAGYGLGASLATFAIQSENRAMERGMAGAQEMYALRSGSTGSMLPEGATRVPRVDMYV